MNVTVFFPFAQKLRIHFPDDFRELQSLYGEDYTLLFPENKEYVLMVSMTKNSKSEYSLAYFFYDQSCKEFYKWSYPEPRIALFSYHHSQDIIDDIKEISNWNDCRFLNSSRTLDDLSFWNNYVLKKENGEYKYLEKIYFSA
jgi:hypothetical protein